MSAIARRLAKLERSRPSALCGVCDGAFIGVIFNEPAPGDYEVGPDGRKPPFPPECPRCGRAVPKTYVLQNRAVWDAI